MRVNSHSGPGFDWGVGLGFFDGAKRAHVLVADNAVGFSGPYANSFLNDLFFAMDTTDDVHAYRVTKTAGVVSLFVDTFTAPVLAIPYDEFIDDDRAYVTMPRTPEFCVANVDVLSIAYNLDGTLVPEPSTALLLAAGGWLALHRRRAR